MLNNYEFKSIFKDELNYFIKYKRSLGFKYENEVYEEKAKRLPKVGAIVKTEDGIGEVDSIETLKEQYDQIKDKISIDIELDKYELYKSPKKIIETLELIDKDLKLIESKKQELLTKKEIKLF